MKLGVLVSGRGSNLAAVLDAIDDGRLPNVEPVLVISNRPDVRALTVAAEHGVPARVVLRGDFPAADERDAAIGTALRESGADLALLAGYDRLLHRSYFDAFGGRTINIHPSLLPRHGGAGMVGLAVHRAVLAARDMESGVTVHEVSAELDAGAVIARGRVPVRADDAPETLAARVLHEEHRLIVEVLAAISSGREDGGSSGSMAAAPPTSRSSGPQ